MHHTHIKRPLIALSLLFAVAAQAHATPYATISGAAVDQLSGKASAANSAPLTPSTPAAKSAPAAESIDWSFDAAKAKENFDGFYVGTVLGGEFHNETASHYYNFYADDGICSDNLKGLGPFYGLQLGAHISIGRLFISQEFSIKHSHNDSATKYMSGGDEEHSFKFNANKNLSLEIQQKIGMYITPKLGVYLSISAINTNFKLKAKFRPEVNPYSYWTKTYRKNIWGAGVGIGIVYKFSTKLILSFGYGYHTYQKFEHDFDDTPGYDQTARLAPKFHSSYIGLHYKF